MFEVLAGAVDGLEIPVHGDALAEVLRVRDRLDARIALAVAGFEQSGGWEVEGASSMTAWLRDRAGMARRDAGRVRLTGRRLRELPVLADAAIAGSVTGGQVQAVVTAVTDLTLPILQVQETEVVPVLAGLDAVDTVTVLSAWQAKAHALVEPERGDERDRSLFLSSTIDNRWEGTFSLDALGGGIVDTAVRAAAHWHPEDQRSPAERRADALVDVCQWFLDHRTEVGTRNRPHLNVVLTTDRYGHPLGGRLLDGPALPEPSWQTLTCDCVLHRVLHDQTSVTLDYGRATRTISPALRTVLAIRDRHCRFPGCDRPTSWCDAHHLHPWETGGTTDQTNLVLLCTRHHHQLHRPGWHTTLHPDATLHVTHPDGTTRTSRPPGRPHPGDPPRTQEAA